MSDLMTCGAAKTGPSLYSKTDETKPARCDLQGGHGGNNHSGIVDNKRICWKREHA